jgi:hypothetical protein
LQASGNPDYEKDSSRHAIMTISKAFVNLGILHIAMPPSSRHNAAAWREWTGAIVKERGQ